MLGLKRGIVALYDHEISWEENAALTMEKLQKIFGAAAKDMQHVGSTSIVRIKAKPIIDIAVAVNSFADVYPLIPLLEAEGIRHGPENDQPWQVFFFCGNDREDTRTHHIHVVKTDSREWRDYINFRDYLNACPEAAGEYETVKRQLGQKYQNDRLAYTEGKDAFVKKVLLDALAWRN
ncbi:protein of unknown function UPF0157 [Syntrophobotulus glycolicus DSM 8271]|uniref:GrpB family protein n=2 Tax=Syntrophobotulus TaxID=51196 RepID=F0T2H2_SYNGF|nr:protein of unknown function UPF0157 [Syntrophobotulus glycolicus DSM 8271]